MQSIPKELEQMLPPNEVEQEELGEAAGSVKADDDAEFACDDAARWLLT
jgi:hypothetical protein